MFQSQTSPATLGPLHPSPVWLAETTTDFPRVAWATHSTPTWGYRDPGLILLVLNSLGEIHLEEVVAAGVPGADLEGSEGFSDTETVLIFTSLSQNAIAAFKSCLPFR